MKKLLAFLTGISLAFLACDGSSSSPAFPETTPESSSSIATSLPIDTTCCKVTSESSSSEATKPADSISSKTEIRSSSSTAVSVSSSSSAVSFSSSSIAIPFFLSSSSWNPIWDVKGCCPESGAQTRVITLNTFGDTVNVTLGEQKILRDSLCIPPPPSVIIITCNPPKITVKDSVVIDSNNSRVSNDSVLKDTRDGETYKIVKIGDRIWMAENLRFSTANSKCYKDDPNNCKEYGALYMLSEAKNACPTGWHLPTAAEWPEESNGFVTNHPGTYYAKLTLFGGIDVSAHFWTSSTDAQKDDCPIKILTGKDSAQLKSTCAENANDLLSIRCVKN